jgi:LPXTG-site transpeptidase (sortase) family protein
MKTRFIPSLLLWIGLGMLAYSGGTVAYGAIQQKYLSWIFHRKADTPSAAIQLQEGDLVGKLEIPRVEISVMILQGTEDATLTEGAGHVAGTPLPAAEGNVAIAAHRDTYFRNLKGIRVGDSIHFSTMQGSYDYVVDSTETVDPEDTRVLESRDRRELTLITCYPFYFVGSAPKRFIVHARPAESGPETTMFKPGRQDTIISDSLHDSAGRFSEIHNITK